MAKIIDDETMENVCLLAKLSLEEEEREAARAEMQFSTAAVLSHRWIQQAESNYGIDMQIYDGNTPLFFEQLHGQDNMRKIFDLAKKSLQKITD